MASPAGANSAASSSRGPPLPLPLPFPFPAAAHFPSRAAVPSLPQHQHPPATSDSDGGEEVEEDEGSIDDDSGEEDETELADGAAHGSQQRRASSAPGIGRAAMNGDNGARHIQEEHQWQQYGCTSSGGDEPGTIPREMRVENGYRVIGRREGGPASSYWDLLRAHLSDPLT